MTVHILTPLNAIEGGAVAKRVRAFAEAVPLDMDPRATRWHQPRVGEHLDGVGAAEAGEALWGALEGGDTVVAASLAELGNSPLQVRQAVDRMAKAGVTVYSADLGRLPLNQRLDKVKAWARLEVAASDRLAAANSKLRGLETELSAKFDREIKAAAQLLVQKNDVLGALLQGLPAFRGSANGSGARYGQSIRERREFLGLTQGQLAEQVGVSVSSISRLESKGSGECEAQVHAVLWPEG